ncbi:MAG: ferredoxin family protein [Chloroflexi bacterium]|nr:ferredoxin family protein [Chloroflexota bacterium]
MAITSIDPFLCIGCRICVDVCIDDVLIMSRGKATIRYPEECVACLFCELLCPRYAIKVMPNVI